MRSSAASDVYKRQVADFAAACRGELSLERLNENTLAVLGIMDTVRLREGIVFPHDGQ